MLLIACLYIAYHASLSVAYHTTWPSYIALYARLVSVSNIRLILSNRTQSIKFVVSQNIVIQSLNLCYN